MHKYFSTFKGKQNWQSLPFPPNLDWYSDGFGWLRGNAEHPTGNFQCVPIWIHQSPSNARSASHHLTNKSQMKNGLWILHIPGLLFWQPAGSHPWWCLWLSMNRVSCPFRVWPIGSIQPSKNHESHKSHGGSESCLVACHSVKKHILWLSLCARLARWHQRRSHPISPSPSRAPANLPCNESSYKSNMDKPTHRALQLEIIA